MRFKTMLLLLVVLLAGCSVVGPFVTDIKKDGSGNLIIEKRAQTTFLGGGPSWMSRAETSTVKEVK